MGNFHEVNGRSITLFKHILYVKDIRLAFVNFKDEKPTNFSPRRLLPLFLIPFKVFSQEQSWRLRRIHLFSHEWCAQSVSYIPAGAQAPGPKEKLAILSYDKCRASGFDF